MSSHCCVAGGTCPVAMSFTDALSLRSLWLFSRDSRIWEFHVNDGSVLYMLLVNTLYYGLVMGTPSQSCKQCAEQNVSI